MNKLLVITGGSRGIGLASLKLFANAGYSVINLSRSSTDLDLVEQISVDFSQQDWPQKVGNQLISSIEEKTQIVLIHDAALLLKDNASNAPDFAKVLQINLIAPQQLNELLIPKMAKGSSILYVGSTLSTKAVANTLSYSTSKHGILGLMRATCQDLVGAGIHTACVRPGFTDTEMLRDHVGQDAEVLNMLGESNAFGRLVKPEEIAASLKFCAENPAVNGTSIDLNLGQIEH